MAQGEQDLALDSNGCTLSHASCKHEELAPPENVLNGSRATFWATTGLYPHHFTLTFPGVININGVKIRSYYVKNMYFESTDKSEAVDFQEVKSVDLQPTDLHHQITELKLDGVSSRHLRFHVKEGFEEFCAIYKVEVFGDSLERDERLTAVPVTPVTSVTPSIGAGLIRTTSQVSAAQLAGRHAPVNRPPQGLRMMQSMTSTGIANGTPPSATGSRLPFQLHQGSLPSQPHTPETPSSTAERNSNLNARDLSRFGEEDW